MERTEVRGQRRYWRATSTDARTSASIASAAFRTAGDNMDRSRPYGERTQPLTRNSA